MTLSKIQIPDLTYLVGDSKLSDLTIDQCQTEIDPEIQQFLLNNIAHTKDLSKINVLDFGCGRGQLVGQLRSQGWNAYGVDISSDYILKGKLVNELYKDEYPTISIISQECQTLFPKDFFDVIITDQVLEHVENLDQILQEFSRLLKPEGIMFHRFPSWRIVREPHYFIPFAHWFPPKSLARYIAIRLGVSLGLGPKLNIVLNKKDKSMVIAKYADSKTYYRSPKILKSEFLKYGFYLDFKSELLTSLLSKINLNPNRFGIPKVIWIRILSSPLLLDLIGSLRVSRVVVSRLPNPK